MTRIFNLETTKIELHFEKSEYAEMTEENKKLLKSNYLWSNKGKCWVSRAKEPNLYFARQTADKLGFTEEIREGERLSFSEQLQIKQEKAGNRAERYETYSANAENRAEQLQKPINDMNGDIAFFTQPNINSSSGRAFTNRRERMFNAYHRGIEEYKKSEYFQDRADTARATANMTELKDIAFCQRRIDETRKSIKAREKNLINYENRLYRIEKGEVLKLYNGEILTADEVKISIENELELINVLMDKEAFYQNCIDEQGGIKYSKSNIKVGYIVKMQRWGNCEIVGTGPKNITYRHLTGGCAGLSGQSPYTEILEVIEETEKVNTDKHNFKIGEKYNFNIWDEEQHKFIKKEYTITKTTDKTVTLECEGEKVNRKPTKYIPYRADDKASWRLCFDDMHSNTIYKPIEM